MEEVVYEQLRVLDESFPERFSADSIYFGRQWMYSFDGDLLDWTLSEAWPGRLSAYDCLVFRRFCDGFLALLQRCVASAEATVPTLHSTRLIRREYKRVARLWRSTELTALLGESQR